MANKYYGITVEKFFEEYADRFCDYAIADTEFTMVNVDNYKKLLKTDDEFDRLNTWGRITRVVENEEECTIYMQNHIYF